MADDKIVIEYEVKTANLEKSLDRVEKDLKGIETAGKNTFKKVGDESAKTGVAVKKTGQEVSQLGNKFKDLANQLPFAGQIQQVTQLGSAVSGLGGAAAKSSSGFQVLKLAIASTGIGLLIAAVVSLIAYFKRTDEGAAKLSGIMSGLGAAMDIVTGFVAEFGENVFNALSSVQGLKDGLSNLGDFLINNLLNRIKAPLVAFEALQLAIGGDFEKASLRFLDATAQLASGVTDVTSKAGDMLKKMEEAAAVAFEWEQELDKLDDKIREDSVSIAKNEAAITKLIIASKNKQLSDEESLALLDLASKKERENVKLVLDNEEAKLKLIQEKNQALIESINQNKKVLTDELKNEKTTLDRKREIRKELLSIDDKFAQEEIDQQIKIIKLKEDSANREEKINNRRDAKKEEIFQNELKRLAEEETKSETILKQQFVDRLITAEKFEQDLFNIKLEGLKSQRQLLVDSGRSTTEIDKAIIDLQLSQRIKGEKEKEELNKKETADFFKMVDERIKYEEEAKKEADKKDEERRAKNKQIASESLNIATDLVNGLYDNLQDRRQMDLEEEGRKLAEESDLKIQALDNQLKSGLISQETYDAKKRGIEKKKQADEAAIKKKQFEQSKKASLVQVAIDTASAIVKAFATVPFPGSIAAAAFVAAAGLAQVAVISSQPTPKFKDGVIGLEGKGTGTSDSIHAMLSKGESVMTARETQTNRPILEAIRNNNIDDHINKSYVLPALKSIEVANNRERLERLTSNDRKLDSILNNINLDTSNLERVTKRNKDVGIKNTDELARKIANEFSKNNNWTK